jgi:hypothetical protein
MNTHRPSLGNALCAHWQELPPKYGPDAWELRVWDDHWYRVFSKRVVICPHGVGLSSFSTTEEAKRFVEQKYREALRHAIERAHRTTLQANAGLAMLDA